nr:MAG TPA: hypothetical protein [Caudoviricetes sp.]
MIYNILIQRVHFLAKFVFLHVIFFILIILSLFTYP